MSSRSKEKQRRREERQAQERQAAARERRVRRLRVVAAAGLGLLTTAGVAGLTALAGGGDAKLPRDSASAFGQHYEGLEQRRLAAGVATMSSPSASTHTHPKLAMWASGKRVTVPANIGIDPRRAPGDMASLHTHDAQGTVHNEGQASATLGQFFAVWGVAVARDRLGPYRARAGNVIQMWVDGKPSTMRGSLKLADGQDIQVTFGPRRNLPPPDSTVD